MENEELLENITDLETLREMVRDRQRRIDDLVKLKVKLENSFKLINDLYDQLLDKLIGNQC